MSARQLDVLINNQLVGHLREENNLWQFDYAAPWQNSPAGFDLSPALPRSQGRHLDGASLRPVQWYFDNLLPEEGLREVIAKEAELDAEDAFGLLAHYGAESAGSLVLTKPEAAGKAERGLRSLPLPVLNERILNLPRTSLGKDAPKHMSLAGAQHKLLVVFKNGELFEPLPGTPSTHILKPNHPGQDYPASVVNEYFSMRLAAALGLATPAVHRLYAPQPVYIVERFDRLAVSDSEDGIARRHVIDTCQLLNKARSFKYSAAHLETLALAIGHCRSKAVARLQLYRWIVFNALLGNGDNHLKNISFTIDAGGINVAPAYDLLCTAVYDTPAMANEKARWPSTLLALSLGDARTFAELRRGHLLAAGESLGLSKATAQREIDRMLKTALPEADQLIGEIEASAEQDTALSPDPAAARRHIGGELRLLRTIRHVVLAEMCQRLA